MLWSSIAIRFWNKVRTINTRRYPKRFGILIASRKIVSMYTLPILYYSFICSNIIMISTRSSRYDSYINKVFLSCMLSTEGRTANQYSVHCVLWVRDEHVYNIGLVLLCVDRHLLPHIFDKFEKNANYTSVKPVTFSTLSYRICKNVCYVQNCPNMECNFRKHFCWYRNWNM